MRGAALIRTTATLPVAMGRDAWAALLLVTIGTNALDFATAPVAGARPGLAFGLSACVRVALVFWITYAVQRRVLGQERAFRIERPFWPFLLLQFGFAVGLAMLTAILMRATGKPATLATEWLIGFLAMALWSLAAHRLFAWSAAVSRDGRLGALPALWKAQRGQGAAILRALAALILPVAAVHLALTLIAVRLPMGATGHLAIALVDGVVSSLQLVLVAALGANVLRLASGAQAR